MKPSYRFSLRWNLVLFTTILALITYSFTAVFIYVVYDSIRPYWSIPRQWFIIMTS